MSCRHSQLGADEQRRCAGVTHCTGPEIRHEGCAKWGCTACAARSTCSNSGCSPVEAAATPHLLSCWWCLLVLLGALSRPLLLLGLLISRGAALRMALVSLRV